MFSYIIEVVETDDEIAVRAKPTRTEVTPKELEVGTVISSIVHSALIHISIRRQNGLVIDTEQVDSFVGHEIDKLFDGK